MAAAVLTGLAVTWATRPVRRTAQRLGLITHENIAAEHLDGIYAVPELEPVQEAIRQMLARLDEAARRQKRFIGDASHELRTPLAVAKSTLQALQVRPRSAEEYARAIEEVLDDLRRMERLTTQLLDLARLEEPGKAPGQAVRLDELLCATAADGAGGQVG
ncbi:MAG: hypothetical protein J7M21_04760 [Planctomycetes bacterium]|nr:hypothetical protein [Planctomycetota bacterium]